MTPPTVYLASPLGFAHSTATFMAQVVAAISPYVTVLNPWDDQRFAGEITSLAQEDSFTTRLQRLGAINTELARSNAANIDRADALIAILDGVDVDSGTAAEIGYAFARGKHIDGLRTDFRLAGDNHGAIVNLQVQYFIEASGGRVVTSLPALVSSVRDFAVHRG